MPRKSTKTEVKATETAIETKVEDIKTEDKAAETKVAEETATGSKKAPAKKTASKSAETKATKTTGAKAAKETGAKAPRSTAKTAEAKISLEIQYAEKAWTMEDLEKIVRGIWKDELKQKAGDLQGIELYVKPEENKVYYVMNGEHKGSFDI